MNAVISITNDPFPAKITSFPRLQINIPRLNENNAFANVCDRS